jgi:hypothetical protein
VTYNYNDLPYGTNFIDVHPENIDPRTGRRPPANFLRPYQGYGAIGFVRTPANRLQLAAGAVNPRYIRALQFALGLHLAKGYDTRVTSPYVAADQDWFWRAPTGGTQLHNLRSATPGTFRTAATVGQLADPRRARRLAALGQHRVRLGDWSGVTFTTTDNFDFYGGGAGGRIVLTGVDPTQRRQSDPNPDGTGSYLNWAAFARPSAGWISATHGAVLPAALDQEHGPVDVQELRVGRRSGSRSAGRSTTCSTR